MKEYVAPAIAGVFAVATAILAWRLKNSSDEQARRTALEKERRDEVRQLYTTTFVLFEQAIRQVLQKEEFRLAREFSEINAKMHLLAPEKVTEQYFRTSRLLEEWSRLHAKASRPQWDLNGKTVTLFQSPDPAEQFRAVAQATYETLQTELQCLIKIMRTDLAAEV